MNSRSTSERIIAEAMNSGNYSIAGLEIFDTVMNLDISDNVIKHLKYTTEILMEHLDEVSELGDKKPGLVEYLRALKMGDIVDNQSLERENSFLIGLYMQVKKENAIDKIIKLIKQKGELSSNDISRIHNTLLYGTSSEGVDLVRTKNDKFVGTIDNNGIQIDYLPIDYHDIKKALEVISKIYNGVSNYEYFDDLLLRPFLIHGLFGALQMFNDGNTRMGRLMQHALIWRLINKNTEYNFENPPIYATRSYFPYRGEYRDIIASLVVDNNSEAWNRWFKFNLYRIEDQIYANNENMNQLKQRRLIL